MTEGKSGETFKPGDLLNNTYRIETVLGRGGTSEVYRARSEISGRVVAIKVLKAEFSQNDDYLVLMTREEEIREIRHDAIVRYSETHRLPDGQVYLVMDYVEGPGLDAKLRAGGMSAKDLLQVTVRVAEGLGAAHARHIVHRDLSPDNIILRGDDPAQAVIIDFGIAKDSNPGAATIIGNEFAGKYAYAAPEQLEGKSDRRSDIYSLGALILATFRGKAPDMGRNPMEVVQRKALPLDTEGVPEPLKSLLDKMTAPDPDARYQSINDLLDAVDPMFHGTVVPLRFSTIPPNRPGAKAEEAPPPPPIAPQPASGGGRRWIALLAIVLLLVGVGAGGYVAGFWQSLLGPRLPVAEPFTFIAEKKPDMPPHAVGNVPSEEVKSVVEARLAAQGGTAQLTPARGDIGDDWGSAITDILARIGPLPEWRMVTRNDEVAITGLTLDRGERDRLNQDLNSNLPEPLRGKATIVLGPRLVTQSELLTLLDTVATCGPLEMVDPPANGYGMESTIVLGGNLAAPQDQRRITDALAERIGDRQLEFQTEILNDPLCEVAGLLPPVGDEGIEIAFATGDAEIPNPDGTFRVGENPVIDVVLPETVTSGELWVSIVDVSGKVFHLLPNRVRPTADIATLRNGVEGPLRLRLAYGLNDPERSNGLAFLVDDSSLGLSEVVVIHAATPFFETLRPMEESVAGFGEALKERVANGGLKILGAQTRVLETVP